MRFFTLLFFVLMCWPDPLLFASSPEEAVHLALVIRIPTGFLFMFLFLWQFPDDLRALRKCMGSFPRIWYDSRSNLLHLQRDANGWITDLIYSGQDRSSRDELYARWNRDRGVVWQAPGNIYTDLPFVRNGTLVVPLYKDSVLQGFDIETGKRRFRHGYTQSFYSGDGGVWLKGDRATYLFDNGDWIQLKCTTGELVANGQLEDPDESHAISAGTEQPHSQLPLSSIFSNRFLITPKHFPELLIEGSPHGCVGGENQLESGVAA